MGWALRYYFINSFRPKRICINCINNVRKLKKKNKNLLSYMIKAEKMLEDKENEIYYDYLPVIIEKENCQEYEKEQRLIEKHTNQKKPKFLSKIIAAIYMIKAEKLEAEEQERFLANTNLFALGNELFVHRDLKTHKILSYDEVLNMF